MKDFLDYKPQKTQDTFLFKYANKQMRMADRKKDFTSKREWKKVRTNALIRLDQEAKEGRTIQW